MQNNSIHAIIQNNIAKKFKPFLQKGKLYELSYFQVVDGNALYRPVDNDIKIINFRIFIPIILEYFVSPI